MRTLRITVKTMALDYEALKELQQVLDDRYVLQSDCNEKQEAVNGKFAHDDKRIDKLIDRMNVWSKLLWAIATSTIGTLAVAVMELILK